MKPFAVVLLVFLGATARAEPPGSVDALCSAAEYACPLAPIHAHGKSHANTQGAVTVVRIEGRLHPAANAYPLSFEEVTALHLAPVRLVEPLVRSDGPYMFALDTERVQAEVVAPPLLWPAAMFPSADFRSAMPSLDPSPAARATGIIEFQNVASAETWLRPASRLEGAALSPHTKLGPLHAELLSRMRHVELLAQFEPARRHAPAAEVFPRLSIVLPLLLGLLVVMVRRAPLRSRPNGLWLVGTHP